jgi:hypothetical protein
VFASDVSEDVQYGLEIMLWADAVYAGQNVLDDWHMSFFVFVAQAVDKLFCSNVKLLYDTQR